MKLDSSDVQRAWDGTHQEKPIHKDPEPSLLAFAGYVRRRVSTGALVLDLGCGRGRNSLHLTQQGFAVIGCDLSPVAVQVARAQAQEARTAAVFHVANLTRLPYSDSCFGAVVCVHVFPYQFKSDIGIGVREVWRVLHPGGWLYLDLLERDDAEYGCGPELEAHTFLDPGGVPIHFSSLQEVTDLMNGFEVERLSRLELGSSRRPRVAWEIWARKGKRSAYTEYGYYPPGK